MKFVVLKRIQVGNKCYYSLGNLFKFRILSNNLTIHHDDNINSNI